MIKINFKFKIGNKVKFKLWDSTLFILSRKYGEYGEYGHFTEIRYGVGNTEGILLNPHAKKEDLELIKGNSKNNE